VIALLLPNKSRGVPRVDNRKVSNAIFCIHERARLAACRARYGPDIPLKPIAREPKSG
jgi:transposase